MILRLYALFVLASPLLLAAYDTPSRSYRNSPTSFSSGGYRRSEAEPEKTVSVVLGNSGSLTLEQSAVVKLVWYDVVKDYTYSDDGELQLGQGGQPLVETPEMIGAFYRWVSQNPVRKIVQENEKCTVCPGSGTIVVYEDAQRLRFRREACDACNGTGKRQVSIAYLLTCPADRLPPKGQTPRQRSQSALEASAASGDATARLKLAGQLRSGAVGVVKDEAKAQEIYFKLACEGNIDGLKGYAELLIRSARTQDEKAYAAVMLRAWSHLSGESLVDADLYDMPYLDRLHRTLLTGAAVDIFVRRTLAKEGQNYPGLIKALDIKGQPPVRALVILRLKSGEQVYDRATMTSLMTTAQGLDPEAFAVLASICETGADGICRFQSAYAYYSMADQLKPALGLSVSVERLAKLCDTADTVELLNAFTAVRPTRKCPRTLIEAAYNLKSEAK